MTEFVTSTHDLDREHALDELERADRLPIHAIVTDLVGWLGLGLTAMAGGVRETRFVRPWIEGRRGPAVRRHFVQPGVRRTSSRRSAARKRRKRGSLARSANSIFRSPISVLREHA